MLHVPTYKLIVAWYVWKRNKSAISYIHNNNKTRINRPITQHTLCCFREVFQKVQVDYCACLTSTITVHTGCFDTNKTYMPDPAATVCLVRPQLQLHSHSRSTFPHYKIKMSWRFHYLYTNVYEAFALIITSIEGMHWSKRREIKRVKQH